MGQTSGILIAAGNAATNPDPNTMGPTITANTGTEVITSSVAHGYSAGDALYFLNSGGALPTGLTAGTLYYAGLITPTSFQVFTSAANAIAGTSPVDITGAGSGTNYIAPVRILEPTIATRRVASTPWAALTTAGTYSKVMVPRSAENNSGQVPLLLRFEPLNGEAVTYTVIVWRLNVTATQTGASTRPWAKPVDTPAYTLTGSEVVPINNPGVTPWAIQLSSISAGNIRIWYDNGLAEGV
jgi:hypothetical protein